MIVFVMKLKSDQMDTIFIRMNGLMDSWLSYFVTQIKSISKPLPCLFFHQFIWEYLSLIMKSFSTLFWYFLVMCYKMIWAFLPCIHIDNQTNKANFVQTLLSKIIPYFQILKGSENSILKNATEILRWSVCQR